MWHIFGIAGVILCSFYLGTMKQRGIFPNRRSEDVIQTPHIIQFEKVFHYNRKTRLS